MKTIALAAFVIAIPVLAIASDVTVTVVMYSDPAGATVYANSAEQRVGYAPVKMKYKLSSADWKAGACRSMQPVKVRWASGAEAALPAVEICPKDGKAQQLTFVRPPEVPGRDLDVNFALELQRISAQQIAAANAEIAAIPPPAKTVYCHSYVIGSQVFTNCN